jgi:hypothetical protein
MLAASGMKAPGFMKTGTTIAGIIFKVGQDGTHPQWRRVVVLC